MRLVTRRGSRPRVPCGTLDTVTPPRPDGSADETVPSLALIAELAKKTGVCWLRYDGATHPAWHAWVSDALFVVSGGAEQPLPGIEHAARTEVTMRSKDHGGRLLTWVGAVSVVRPEDELWEPVTAALVTGRLNLADPAHAPEQWARHSVVTRIAPTAEVVERPGTLSAEAHLAAPQPTPATTRGRLPRVLHRRGTRRPDLS